MKYQQNKLYEAARNIVLTGLLMATPFSAGCLKSTDPYVKAEQSLDTVAKYANRKPRTEAEAKRKEQFMAKAKENIVQIVETNPEFKEEIWDVYTPSEKQQKAIETVNELPLDKRIGVLKSSEAQIDAERNKLYGQVKPLDEAAKAIQLYDVSNGDMSKLEKEIENDDPEVGEIKKRLLSLEVIMP